MNWKFIKFQCYASEIYHKDKNLLIIVASDIIKMKIKYLHNSIYIDCYSLFYHFKYNRYLSIIVLYILYIYIYGIWWIILRISTT